GRQFADLVHDPLLRVGRDGRLGFFHCENDVLSIFGDLRQHCEHKHIDCAGTLAIVRRRVIAFASCNKRSNDAAQMCARKVRHLKMELNSPSPRYVSLERCVDAFQYTEMPNAGSLATVYSASREIVSSHICGLTSLRRRMMSRRLPRSRLSAREPVRS